MAFGEIGRSSLFAQAPQQKKSLVEQLPRIPAVAPADALKTFTVQKGFRLELVANEPLVSDPVDACFDEFGRLFVVEMHGYPFSQEPTRLNPNGGGKRNAGIVRLLEDRDGDGRYEHSVKFADNITWPTSVCCYDGGVFVLAPPHLHYFKDTNGDGKADVKEIVYSGFDRGNVQALANNLKWSLENKILGAGGRNPGTLKRKGKTVFRLGRLDFAFNPRTKIIEPITGGEQFGHSLDDWGNRFVCSNSNHIRHVVFPLRYLNRNKLYSPPSGIRSIAKEGAAAKVFRKSSAEPWRVVRTARRVADPKTRARLSHTEQFAIGYFTSATGVTIYRGDAYPKEFRGNAFIGDVGGNLIHRKTVKPSGVSFVAERADQGAEFIASTDNWFRPVNFVNAPDGSLYILDMYRETIEHPHSVPDDIKKHLDLQGGHDRGRIYRLVYRNHRTKPKLPGKMTNRQLVASLKSPNGWLRETAHRLLWERQDRKIVPDLKKLISDSNSALAKIHAMWILDGMNELDEHDLLLGLRSTDFRVQKHAVQLVEPRFSQSPKLQNAVVELCEKANVHVAFQLAFSVGELPVEKRVAVLEKLSQRFAGNRDVQAAILTSSAGIAGRFAVGILEKNQRDLLLQLAGLAGHEPNVSDAVKLFASTLDLKENRVLQQQVFSAMDRGLKRRKSSLQKLVRNPEISKQAKEMFQNLLYRAAEAVVNRKQKIADRISAVRFLALAPDNAAANILSDLLNSSQPVKLQVAVVDALAEQSPQTTAEQFLSKWRGLSPLVRKAMLGHLVQQSRMTRVLLDRIEKKKFARSNLERTTIDFLRNHPVASIRQKSRTIFVDDVSADRKKVIARYLTALELESSATNGRNIFRTKCATCHRIGNDGHAVGPDLVSVTNKSPRDFLISILDPNRESQPNFHVYNVLTESGKVYSGIVTAENANSITLLQAEGKKETVLRSNIDELISLNKSLMPERMEKEITPQQMADLLKFLQSLRKKSSTAGKPDPMRISGPFSDRLSAASDSAARCEIRSSRVVPLNLSLAVLEVAGALRFFFLPVPRTGAGSLG